MTTMKFQCLYVRDNGHDQEVKMVPAHDPANRTVWKGEKSGIVFLHGISKENVFTPGKVYNVVIQEEFELKGQAGDGI